MGAEKVAISATDAERTLSDLGVNNPDVRYTFNVEEINDTPIEFETTSAVC